MESSDGPVAKLIGTVQTHFCPCMRRPAAGAARWRSSASCRCSGPRVPMGHRGHCVLHAREPLLAARGLHAAARQVRHEGMHAWNLVHSTFSALRLTSFSYSYTHTCTHTRTHTRTRTHNAYSSAKRTVQTCIMTCFCSLIVALAMIVIEFNHWATFRSWSATILFHAYRVLAAFIELLILSHQTYIYSYYYTKVRVLRSPLHYSSRLALYIAMTSLSCERCLHL